MRDSVQSSFTRYVIHALLIALLFLNWNPAFAADPNVREIQRLLWALGYRAERLDGVASTDMRTRISKFLSDRDKSGLRSDDDVLAELRSAFEAKRLAATNASKDPEIIDRRAVQNTNTMSTDLRMVVSPEDDLVLGGSCKTINRFRLSSSAPLREYKGICNGGSFVFSRPLGLIAATSSWFGNFGGLLRTLGGLLLIDAASGLNVDFIEIPEDLLFSKLNIHPNGREVIVLSPTRVWHVDLATRSVATLFMLGVPNVVTKGVHFSPDGRVVSIEWSSKEGSGKFVDHLKLWDLGTGTQIAEYSASGAVFSRNGDLTALQIGYGAAMEIRETRSGRLIAQRKFNSDNPLMTDADVSTAFSTDGASMLYVPHFGHVVREWTFSNGSDRQRFSLDGQPSRVVIDPAAGKLFAAIDAGIFTYDLGNGAALTRPAGLQPIEPRSAAISLDKSAVALQTREAITVWETSTAGARLVNVPGLNRSDNEDISAIAFLPGSERLLVGTSKGKLAIVNTKTGDRQEVAALGQEITALATAHTRPLAAAVVSGKLIVLDVSTGRTITQTVCDGFTAASNNIAFVDGESRVLFPDKHNAVVLDIASGRRILDQELKTGVTQQGTLYDLVLGQCRICSAQG